jgi:hypothetical protein
MSKIVRHGDSYGVYRNENDETIYGKSRFVYIKNLSYYLTEMKIYSDGMIDCWGLMNLDEFKQKLESGWVTLSIPEGATVDIHMLSSLKISEADNYISDKEFLKEIQDIIADLNDEPTSLELCRSSYERYLNNQTAENKKKLRQAYYAMPEHMRHFVLGDMQAKDSPITTIIDKVDVDEIELKFPFKKDEKFIDLYKQVAKGEIPYYWAVIKIDGIKPFTEADVEIDDGFRKHFLEKYTEGKPISIHVYQDSDVFVMSDDYVSFALYKGLGVKTIPCLVMGEPKGDFVIDKMKINFQPPTVQIEQK